MGSRLVGVLADVVVGGAVSDEIGELETSIATVMAVRPHQHLLAIPGVGLVTAAKILGETHDVNRPGSA
ncbi:transposase [Pseudonocardia xishanensis]|uniref:Transposase IS116/IS110/IS902 C-terminal domain-containing protein n=1 Tax=Pseudonocardia xishanensis TaxID=630995 RepID=A0ABP8RW93_9PSEU